MQHIGIEGPWDLNRRRPSGVQLWQPNRGRGEPGMLPKITALNQDAIIAAATNAVDTLTQITGEIVGWDPCRVLGSGTVLETAALRSTLGEHYGVDPRSVHAYVVGEHGDSDPAPWSLADITGVRLADFVDAHKQRYDQVALDRFLDQTRNAAREIIQRKRATYYARGSAQPAPSEAELTAFQASAQILKDRLSEM
jgi:L-lactate dehydrogenase